MLAMRLGWASIYLLVYGKGGAAWTNDNYQVLYGLAPGLVPPVASLLFSSNVTPWGMMVDRRRICLQPLDAKIDNMI